MNSRPILGELGHVLAGQPNLPLDNDCSGGSVQLKDSDKFLGTVPEGTTRVLYLISRYYDRVAAEHRVAFDYAATGSVAETQAKLLVNTYKDRADTYRAIFWSSVYDTFPPEGDYAGLPLRQGWAVIASPPIKDHPIINLLTKLSQAGRVKIEGIEDGDD